MKVNFIVAGVQKGGTSSLDAYLRQHSQISMATVKEPHFFDDETEFAGVSVRYENYHRHFRHHQPQRLYGEATPIYTFWPEAMSRIRQYNPEMRLIVLLRNPIERAWAAWRMEKSRGIEVLSFPQAIRTEAERVKEALPLPHRVFSYAGRGFYSEQIQRVLQHFGDQALFIKSEYFFRESQAATTKVFDFLGLERLAVDTSAIHFRGPYEGPPDQADREYLLNKFRPDIKIVENLLQWDCSDWLGL